MVIFLTNTLKIIPGLTNYLQMSASSHFHFLPLSKWES